MGVVYNNHGQAAGGLGQVAGCLFEVVGGQGQVAGSRQQVAWVTSPASHPPDLAGIPTTCPNSLLSLKTNAQLIIIIIMLPNQAIASTPSAPRPSDGCGLQ
jgi:hypothetical protein